MLVQYFQARSLKADALNFVEEKSEKEDPFLVTWTEGDSRNPQNWSLFKKWLISASVVLIAFVVGAAGTINSAAESYAAEKFGVTEEVMTLQDSLYLIGFGLSAPVMGPLSELKGRNPVYLITLLIYSVFCLGSGFAENIQTRAILRFFAGVFGAAPLSNAGGSVADVAGPLQRSYLFPCFSFLGFMGTSIGPVFGGWIGERADQAWCDWVNAIAGFGTVILLGLTMPETLSMELLRHRSSEIRRVTGDDRYTTALERKLRDSGRPFIYEVFTAVLQPVKFLATEPITLAFAFYLTVVYIVLFGDLESYPLIFSIYDWSPGKVGSVFAAVSIGMVLVGALTPITYWHYKKIYYQCEAEGRPVQPETRLFLCMVLTWCMPIALFWAGWTAYPSISPWSLIVSQFVFGVGALACFISSYMYIIDVYQVNAASPLATLVFLRYIVAGAGAITFTRPMFEGIGNHWALSLLGFLSVLVSLIPPVFYIFGPKLRRRSSYAMSQ